MSPDVSIVIPIYNEEQILAEAVGSLLDGLDAVRTNLGAPDLRFEVVLAENGSTDKTVQVAQRLAHDQPIDLPPHSLSGSAAHPGEAGVIVRTFSLGEPNYGKALRQGILEARGTWVICDEIDLCDIDFHCRALDLLRRGEAAMVVGSKAMRGARDQRPLLRRAATRILNGLLRVAVDFRGTDTHGLKAFHRATVVPIVEQCVIDRDLFASELVIRAGRAVDVMEIPIRLAEKRAPAINLIKRVPNVLRGMATLTRVLRFGGRP